MNKQAKLIRRVFYPSRIFFALYFIFLILPSSIIYFLKFYENLWVNLSFVEYDLAAKLFFIVVIFGFIFALFGSLFGNIFFRKYRLYHLYGIFLRNSTSLSLNYNKKIDSQLFYFISFLAIIFLFFYLYKVGFNKILLLGSDLSPKEFRFSVTFEDENSAYNNFLQISRRIFFPMVIVYFFFFYRSLNVFSKLKISFLIFLVASFLLACLITLDRAPIITFIIVFFYIWVLGAKFTLFNLIKVPVFIFLIIILGGLMTYVQHNIIDFKLSDVLESGFNFLWHRVWAAPSIVGIELSTSLFPYDSEKLYMQYSRLGVLFGSERVGSQSSASIYVGPVSFIGDIWRNLGLLGVSLVSFFLGFLFSFLDFVARRVNILYSASLGILCITFVFYLTHGVFFSMGVFFQMIFIFIYSVYILIFPVSRNV